MNASDARHLCEVARAERLSKPIGETGDTDLDHVLEV